MLHWDGILMTTIGSKIRSYFHTTIATATGLPAISILKSPRFQVGSADLPVVAIYTHSDRAEDPNQISDRRHSRVYTVAVEVAVEGRIEEDSTDALAALIRKAILTDGTLGSICTYTTWVSQEWGAKETQVAESATMMLFSCHYMWSPDW